MREEIIKMAREAHVVPYIVGPTNDEYLERLERFFHMAQAAEREACAKVCEEPWMGHPKEIAKAIRARGQQ